MDVLLDTLDREGGSSRQRVSASDLKEGSTSCEESCLERRDSVDGKQHLVDEENEDVEGDITSHKDEDSNLGSDPDRSRSPCSCTGREAHSMSRDMVIQRGIPMYL